VIRGIYFY